MTVSLAWLADLPGVSLLFALPASPTPHARASNACDYDPQPFRNVYSNLCATFEGSQMCESIVDSNLNKYSLLGLHTNFKVQLHKSDQFLFRKDSYNHRIVLRAGKQQRASLVIYYLFNELIWLGIKQNLSFILSLQTCYTGVTQRMDSRRQ